MYMCNCFIQLSHRRTNVLSNNVTVLLLFFFFSLLLFYDISMRKGINNDVYILQCMYGFSDADVLRFIPSKGLNFGSLRDPNEKHVLWNAMIHPLLNMTIYGVIWYQGMWSDVFCILKRRFNF